MQDGSDSQDAVATPADPAGAIGAPAEAAGAIAGPLSDGMRPQTSDEDVVELAPAPPPTAEAQAASTDAPAVPAQPRDEVGPTNAATSAAAPEGPAGPTPLRRVAAAPHEHSSPFGMFHDLADASEDFGGLRGVVNVGDDELEPKMPRGAEDWLKKEDCEDLNGFFSKAAARFIEQLQLECQRKLNEQRERLRKHYDRALQMAQQHAKDQVADFLRAFRAPVGSAVEAVRNIHTPDTSPADEASRKNASPKGCPLGATEEALRLEQALLQLRSKDRPMFDHQESVDFSIVTSKALQGVVENCRRLLRYAEHCERKLKLELVARGVDGSEYSVDVRPAADPVHVLTRRLREKYSLGHFELFTLSGISLRGQHLLKDYDLDGGLIVVFRAEPLLNGHMLNMWPPALPGMMPPFGAPPVEVLPDIFPPLLRVAQPHAEMFDVFGGIQPPAALLNVPPPGGLLPPHLDAMPAQDPDMGFP